MLDFIRKEMRTNGSLPEPVTEAAVNEEIVECTHLLQEMSDLSVAGTDPIAARRISIPLEDEIELTTAELSLLDGRVTNMPGDATVQETDYSKLLTVADFYQEAALGLTQMARETDEQFQSRIEDRAEQLYAKYHAKIVQEGLFGTDKISIDDSRVPSRIAVDFGTFQGHPYVVKLPVAFQVDAKRRITKKQLETAMIVQDSDVGPGLKKAAFEVWGEKVGAEGIDDIWKFVTPVRMIIPVGPDDLYVFAIEFEIDGETKPDYLEGSFSVKTGGSKRASVAEINKNINHNTSSINRIAGGVITKNDAIKMEQAGDVYRAPNRFSDRFIQEEIDFGNPDEAPASDPNAASVSVDAAPASNDASVDATATTDANAAPAADATAPDASADITPTDDKELVTKNDVSDAIAEKVAEKTADDAKGDVNLDATTDADVSADINGDTSTEPEPTEDEISADLGTDTTSETTESPAADVSSVDVENMTLEELKSAAADRVEKMTVQQIKDFLASGEGEAPADATADVAQESFLDAVLEGARTTTQNVKQRILNTMEEMQINLKRIHEGLQKNDMTKRDLGKMWSQVRTSKSQTITTGLGLQQLLGLGWLGAIFTTGLVSASGSMGETYSGEEFARTVNNVLHYLTIAIKRRRGKKAFNEADLPVLEKYYNDINTLVNVTNKGLSATAHADVSLKDIDNCVVNVMDQYDAVKKIVSTDSFADGVVSEAFFLTRGNIARELDLHLRKAIGILNDNSMELPELCAAFKREGKKCNRVIHKASKKTTVFNEVEIKQLIKLNQCLSDLMQMLRPNAPSSEIPTIRRLIQAFTQTASGVVKMLESKKETPVQEAADDSNERSE